MYPCRVIAALSSPGLIGWVKGSGRMHGRNRIQRDLLIPRFLRIAMHDTYFTTQSDGRSLAIGRHGSTPADVRRLAEPLMALGLRRAPRLERLLQWLLGKRNHRLMVARVYSGKTGRCVILLHRPTGHMNLSWRGRLEGKAFASLLVSNAEWW